MNRISNNILTKKILSPIVIYYLLLLLIALSWTNKNLVEPNIVLRVVYTIFFIIPLFRYAIFIPVVITIFATIRMFSVSPFGYLPSQPIFYCGLIFVLYIYYATAHFKSNDTHHGLIILFIIVGISNLINGSVEFSIIISLIIAILMGKFIKSKTQLKLMEIGFILITFFLSIYSFVFLNEFAIKTVATGKFERMYWTDPNYLGSVIVIGIVISFFYYLNNVEEKIIFRIFYLTNVLMGFATLGLLASRGAFIAALLPIIYILYKKTKSIKNIFYVIAFGCIALFILWNTNISAPLIQRFNENTTGTGSERTDIWESSFKAFYRLDIVRILFGGGTNFSDYLCGKAFGTGIKSAHNNYLQILYDYGIIGLVTFLYVFYSWYKSNRNNILATSLILVIAIISMSLSPLIYFTFWFLLVLIDNQNILYRWKKLKYQ
jgi:hypothetical protein